MQSRGGSVGSFASSPYVAAPAAESSSGLRIGSLGAAAVDLGTAKNPVHMMQARHRASLHCPRLDHHIVQHPLESLPCAMCVSRRPGPADRGMMLLMVLVHRRLPLLCPNI